MERQQNHAMLLKGNEGRWKLFDISLVSTRPWLQQNCLSQEEQLGRLWWYCLLCVPVSDTGLGREQGDTFSLMGFFFLYHHHSGTGKLSLQAAGKVSSLVTSSGDLKAVLSPTDLHFCVSSIFCIQLRKGAKLPPPPSIHLAPQIHVPESTHRGDIVSPPTTISRKGWFQCNRLYQKIQFESHPTERGRRDSLYHFEGSARIQMKFLCLQCKEIS